MIDGRFEREILSGEEIRELLGEDSPEALGVGLAGGGREDSASPRARTLIVSRRPADVALIAERLRAAGSEVDVVKHPFTALDGLRRSRFTALITDLDLWANGGALLLDRTRRLERRPPVLFLAETAPPERPALEARARGDGAFGILFRPLRPADVEAAVLALLRPASPGADGSPPPPPPPSTAPAATGAAPAAAAADGELAWLRFFFRAGRSIRAASGRSARVEELVRAGADALAPRAAGGFWRDGDRCLAFLAAAPGEDPAAVFAEVIDRGRDGKAGGDDLVIAGGDDGCLVLLGLPPAPRGAAPGFLEEAGHVLRSALVDPA